MNVEFIRAHAKVLNSGKEADPNEKHPFKDRLITYAKRLRFLKDPDTPALIGLVLSSSRAWSEAGSLLNNFANTGSLADIPNLSQLGFSIIVSKIFYDMASDRGFKLNDLKFRKKLS